MSTDRLDAMWKEIALSTEIKHFEIDEEGRLRDSDGNLVVRTEFKNSRPFQVITSVVASPAPEYRLALPTEMWVPIEYTPPRWD